MITTSLGGTAFVMTGYLDIKANKLNNTLRRQETLKRQSDAKGLRNYWVEEIRLKKKSYPKSSAELMNL